MLPSTHCHPIAPCRPLPAPPNPSPAPPHSPPRPILSPSVPPSRCPHIPRRGGGGPIWRRRWQWGCAHLPGSARGAERDPIAAPQQPLPRPRRLRLRAPRGHRHRRQWVARYGAAAARPNATHPNATHPNTTHPNATHPTAPRPPPRVANPSVPHRSAGRRFRGLQGGRVPVGAAVGRGALPHSGGR